MRGHSLMRFCMITTFYPPYHFGGDATYVRALSRTLVAQGHEVEVIHCVDAYRLKKPQDIPVVASDDGITVHRLKSRFGFLSPLVTQMTGHPGLKSRAERDILARPFDVVHFHNVSLVGGPAIIPWSRAPATLYTLHEHWLLCPTHIFWKNREKACDSMACFSCSLRSGIPPQLWRYTGLVKRSVAAADALLAPSEYTAQRHREAGFTPPIHVLPLFSAIEPPAGIARSPNARPRFLYVGRLTAPKGIIPLLEEFATLPEHELLVVGDGELRSSLEQRFASCPNIRFLGQVPQIELIAIYRSATALVFPSLSPETFGLSIVEAFACGTPAIVHDAGGCREPVDATGAGIVYRTIEELRQSVLKLGAERQLREELGRRARDGFLRLYTVHRHVDQYLGHIDAIRARKGLH
jgi:glycosyltransferase involved in cell wall biosynthesis